MNRTSQKSLLLAAAALAGVACGLPAVAQSTAQAEPGYTIPEVVVTARRRAESIQNVPISITAVTGAELQERGVRSVEDLRTVAPGVNIGGTNRDSASFFIRGQGPGPVQTGQRNFTSVATYFAEVPTTVAGPGVFYDLASVQVLKGPQGTLFGRNTTGGAVLFEPQRPTERNEAYAEISYGDYDFKQFEGAVNLAPVPGKVGLRIATQISRREGYTESILTGQKLDARNYEAARGILFLSPVSALESETIVDYRNRHSGGDSEIVRALDPSLNLGGTVGANPALAGLAQLGPFAGLTAAQVASIPLTLGGGASIGCLSAALPGCPAGPPLPAPFTQFGGLAAALAAAYAGGGLALVAPTSQIEAVLATQRAIGPRQAQIAYLLNTKQIDLGITNRTTFTLTSDITLKNIIAFRRTRQNSFTDLDGSPFPILDALGSPSGWVTGQDQFSEEFQVQGRAPAAKLEYLVGYYFERSTPGVEQQSPSLTVGQYSNRFPSNRDVSEAVFGHFEWNPLSWAGVSGGVRQTWDQRGASLSVFDLAGDCVQLDLNTGLPACPVAFSQDFHATTYDATVNLRPRDRMLVYARFAHGYKGGGINLPAPTGLEVFQPEQVDSYEIGVKADFNWGLPVRIDAAAFYDRYKNQQIQESITVQAANGSVIPTAIVRNIPKAINKGFEAQVTATPTDQISLSGFVSYLDAHSTVSVPNTIVAGRQAANQPKWKYGLNGRYALPLPDAVGTLALAADWSWQSEFFSSPYPSLVPVNPSYGLLNARLSWNNAMGKDVDVALFATNLLDETYVLGGFPVNALGFDAAVYGEPRMFGISVRGRWSME